MAAGPRATGGPREAAGSDHGAAPQQAGGGCDVSQGDLRNTILVGDAGHLLNELPASRVDLCLTSPPYWQARKYGGDPRELGQEESWDEYVRDLVSHLALVRRLLVAGGWDYRGCYIWRKQNPVPCGRMDQGPIEAWEPVLWLRAGPGPHWFDADIGRRPYAPGTVRNGRVHSGRAPRYVRPSRPDPEPNPLGTHPLNVIDAPVGSGDVDWHPAVMPVAVARRLVAAHCPPGGLVLDPYIGSGTTGVAAALEGRDYLGIELYQQMAVRAAARIRAHEGQGRLWG